MTSNLIWLPNTLSLSRIAIAALIVASLQPGNQTSFYITLVLTVVAAATDYFDGKLARYTLSTSYFGYVLDGIGDRAIHIAFVLVISRTFDGATLLCWMHIMREVCIYALRSCCSEAHIATRELRDFSLYAVYFLRAWIFIFLILISGFIPEHLMYHVHAVGVVLGFISIVIGIFGLVRYIKFI